MVMAGMCRCLRKYRWFNVLIVTHFQIRAESTLLHTLLLHQLHAGGTVNGEHLVKKSGEINLYFSFFRADDDKLYYLWSLGNVFTYIPRSPTKCLSFLYFLFQNSPKTRLYPDLNFNAFPKSSQGLPLLQTHLHKDVELRNKGIAP